MSRGRPLEQWEIDRAKHLRVVGGMQWRDIAKLLKRDASGLCRACGNAEPLKSDHRRKKRIMRRNMLCDLPIDSPLHPRNRPMTGI